jgi:hypothetical protein
MNWMTKVLLEFSRLFGFEELHLAMFEPERLPEDRPLVGPEIPELSLCRVVDGIPHVALMSKDTNCRREAVHRACKDAVAKQALIWFVCDTAEQAEQVARLAAWWLPNYRRQALLMHKPDGLF